MLSFKLTTHVRTLNDSMRTFFATASMWTCNLLHCITTGRSHAVQTPPRLQTWGQIHPPDGWKELFFCWINAIKWPRRQRAGPKTEQAKCTKSKHILTQRLSDRRTVNTWKVANWPLSLIWLTWVMQIFIPWIISAVKCTLEESTPTSATEISTRTLEIRWPLLGTRPFLAST